MTVQTATGPVAADALGPTLMHEHVFTLDPELLALDPGWDEEAAVTSATARLAELRGRGITTIVDLTVIGLGRFVERIRRVAEQSGMQIVVATGIYTFSEMPQYFKIRSQLLSPDFVEDFFVREAREGIGPGGILPGILKCATDRFGLVMDVEHVLRATARAHTKTGLPISTHTHAKSKQGLTQQRIFREEGVDLSKVVIGHSGDSTDLEYLEQLIDNGSYLGMDRFGIEVFCAFEARVATVAELCRRGYAERMVLSHDASCVSHTVPPEVLDQPQWARWRYTHISDDVLPALRKAGVSEEDLTTMLVTNPRRILDRG
jgi:phosphotriesterase-related protein